MSISFPTTNSHAPAWRSQAFALCWRLLLPVAVGAVTGCASNTRKPAEPVVKLASQNTATGELRQDVKPAKKKGEASAEDRQASQKRRYMGRAQPSDAEDPPLTSYFRPYLSKGDSGVWSRKADEYAANPKSKHEEFSNKVATLLRNGEVLKVNGQERCIDTAKQVIHYGLPSALNVLLSEPPAGTVAKGCVGYLKQSPYPGLLESTLAHHSRNGLFACINDRWCPTARDNAPVMALALLDAGIAFSEPAIHKEHYLIGQIRLGQFDVAAKLFEKGLVQPEAAIEKAQNDPQIIEGIAKVSGERGQILYAKWYDAWNKERQRKEKEKLEAQRLQREREHDAQVARLNRGCSHLYPGKAVKIARYVLTGIVQEGMIMGVNAAAGVASAKVTRDTHAGENEGRVVEKRCVDFLD